MPYNEQYCPSFQHAVELLCKRWTGLILKVLLAGPQRFGAIAEQIEGVSDRMLSERLKEFEAEGLIERRVYPETPVRIEYRLTEKGQALDLVLDAIATWSHEWVEAEPALAE
jgi:DNA-binding HxlR family transcriptional regulator